jgi:uncharacterized membrane protein YqjE
MRPPAGPGLLGSLRRLLGTALEVVQVRFELIVTELEQQKLRVFDALIWAAVALVLLALGLVLAVGFVVLLLWDTYRLPAVGVLTLLFLGGAALALRIARTRLRLPEGAFAATRAELTADRTALAPRDDEPAR